MKTAVTRNQIVAITAAAREAWGYESTSTEKLVEEWAKRSRLSRSLVRNFVNGTPVKATTVDQLVRPLGLHVAVVVCRAGEIGCCCKEA